MKTMRYIFFFCMLTLSINEIQSKTAALVIAYREYQPLEYGITRDILKNAGITVLTASNQSGKAETSFGPYKYRSAKVDKTVNSLKPDDYDGIFFIGGGGALSQLDNAISYDVLKKAVANDKIVGAICISPRILAKAGVLTGKKATGWNDDGLLSSIFKKYDITYIRENVVIDGKIITATGPAAAQAFANGIISLLRK